ncbi:nucleotide-binding universal stress UspA family protein [Altererythrobacter atlanticus]|uniref:Universal stress protein family protein n=1 Tax=Croceibacterium atlanticum TaxID=1267766 RepID=A0A0F7KY01_9SPHN|nr:universal stress protein [Croceibacterium atlanticum]AKH43690.1 Universal stress protein family protein [Croceibacterium atlanticum]MBB5733826.1 nucleotide-binding universal stress UspA family protein [Croceibacterium atlanticum]
MKNVLVLIHDDAGQEARLQVALDLVRGLKGHLNCIDIVVPPMIVSDYYSGAGEAMVLDYARKHEATNRKTIETRLAQEDVPWDMVTATGFPVDEIRGASELADIIVVTSRSDDEDPLDARRIAGELAVKGERPLLAVPPTAKSFNPRGHALVAWDGSSEANKALRESLPMLQIAETVTLLEVNQPDGEFAVEDAASYLSRHDVHPRIVQKSTEGTIAETLLERASDGGSDYVVMGAYGHSRTVEAIFGGVTVSMLERSEIPLFLAH